ncbi:hypothetical protein SPRG_15153 [Saprolegnia parasitica CBS 223.65]|uniref:EF-hand domain-containing protein n=1 Tax=Saprolegnia parasitica (strain CBS 223.65) TaxID=695850 RepID=A0A067BYC3_SAPPC|nr:hypothetical protein SPRG_15153 [Saprolegnia parasitica CBS 223.65]KDO19572.1 hypothetical protein SPRG_15153 [Saprolegnia parasitica CBS 223.65]|eukprot:XP_012209720.1 hypothetical protein SPRG_15153 [Saprolegnia parasitica CBS 223.65]
MPRLPPSASMTATLRVSMDSISLDQVPANISSVQLLATLQAKTISSATSPVVGGRARLDAPLWFDAVDLSGPGCHPLLSLAILHGETQATLATAVTPLFSYITDKGHVAMLALPALTPTGDRVCVVNVHLHAVRHLGRGASDDTGLLLTFHDIKGSPQWYQATLFLCVLGDAIETTTTSATKTEPSVLLPHSAGAVRIDMYQGGVVVGSGSVKAVPNTARQWTTVGTHQVLVSLSPAAAPMPVVGKLYLEPLEAKVALSWKSPYLRLRAGDLDVYKSSVYKLSDGAPKWTDHVVLNVPTLPVSLSCSLFSRGASLGQTNGSASILAPLVVSDDDFHIDDWLALAHEAGHVHIQATFLAKLHGDVELAVTKLVLSSAATTSGLPTTITVSVPPSLASSSTVPLQHQLASVPSAPVVFSVTNAQASSVAPSISIVVFQGPVAIALASLPLLEVWRRPIPSRWYPLLDRISKDEVGAVRVDLTFTPSIRIASGVSNTTAQWKKLFYMIDSDHSGSISLRELRAALQGNVALQTLLLSATDTRPVEDQIATLFQHLDINGDGQVTFDEYVAGMQAHEQQQALLVPSSTSACTSPRIEALEARVEQLTAALAEKKSTHQPLGVLRRGRSTPARPIYAKHTEWRTTQLSLEYDTSPEALKEQNRQLRAQLVDAESARRLALAKHVQESEKVKRRVQSDRALAHHHLLHRTPPKGLHDDVVVEGKLAMLSEEVQRLRDVNAQLLRMQLQDPGRSREEGDAPENAEPELLGRSTELHALRDVHHQLQSDHADVTDRCQKLQDDVAAAKRLLAAQTERCQSLQQQLHQTTLALQQCQQTKQAQTTRSTVVQSALALELDRQAQLQTQRQAARVAQTTASILLQSKVRMRLQQKRYQAAKMQRAAAVVLLQSRVRGRLARLRFHANLRIHRAAVCIQSNTRRFVCRSKFVHLQAGRWTAARLLQAHVRRWQAQTHLRQCLYRRTPGGGERSTIDISC